MLRGEQGSTSEDKSREGKRERTPCQGIGRSMGIAEGLKLQGNRYMAAQQFENARQSYLKGLEECALKESSLPLWFDLLSNLLEALIKLKRFDGAEHADALELVSNHQTERLVDPKKRIKMLYRCAKIYDGEGHLERAGLCLRACRGIDPDNHEVNDFIHELQRRGLQQMADGAAIQRGPANAIAGAQDDCAICAESLSEICIAYPCEHCFHESCFMSWLNELKPHCPLCRGPIVEGFQPQDPWSRSPVSRA